MPKRPPSYVPPLIRISRAKARQVKTAEASGDLTRGHSRARGYDRTWERLRKMHLSSNPWCVMHLDRGRVITATVVDHIVPISEAPDRRLDPANLQSLCARCHNSTKQRQDYRRRRALREGGPA